MDLYTVNSAQTLNRMSAQRAARELEYRRVAAERAAEVAAARCPEQAGIPALLRCVSRPASGAFRPARTASAVR